MLIKISEDVVIPVEIIPEPGDSEETAVTLADFLGLAGSTISWLADILAYRDLICGNGGAPSPPLPPSSQLFLKENAQLDIADFNNILKSSEIRKDTNNTGKPCKVDKSSLPEGSPDKNNLIIYLLLAILNALNSDKTND